METSKAVWEFTVKRRPEVGAFMVVDAGWRSVVQNNNLIYPLGSMYGICTYIWLISMVNVVIYIYTLMLHLP